MAWGKKKNEVPVGPPVEVPVEVPIPKEEVPTVDTYLVNTICDNCEAVQRLSIPKGMKVKAAIDKMTCTNCGIAGEVRQILTEELIKLSGDVK